MTCCRVSLLAIGMGLTMAPSTESIMGCCRVRKAGVGSAMNDTTRQIGGAVGVAVVGSVMTSVYGSRGGSRHHRCPHSGEPAAARHRPSGPFHRVRHR